MTPSGYSEKHLLLGTSHSYDLGANKPVSALTGPQITPQQDSEVLFTYKPPPLFITVSQDQRTTYGPAYLIRLKRFINQFIYLFINQTALKDSGIKRLIDSKQIVQIVTTSSL